MPRAIWKGAITFVLVMVPVAVYPASHEEDIDFDDPWQFRNVLVR